MSSAEKQTGTMDPTAPFAAPATISPASKPVQLDGTPYRFIAPVGRGGMGDVVEAEHVALGKRVVVKLLQERHAGRPDFVDRMRIEAQALAKITHPNLVQVTDFGQTAEGRTFLVMELLRGRTVQEELVLRKFIPVREAIDILRQTLAGLAAAHEAGIVHRDVKLDNLFLCDSQDGRRVLKVLDFGVAKVVSVMGDNTPLPLAFPTAEGIAMGTPRFFSPEQARGRQVDQRTDIYAAGMVLYHLLAGRGPFDRHTSLLDLSRAHAFEIPEPPSRFATQTIPAALDQAVLKALAKEPAERFPTALDFGAALEKIANQVADDEAKKSAAESESHADEDEPATMRVDVLSAATLVKAATPKTTTPQTATTQAAAVEVVTALAATPVVLPPPALPPVKTTVASPLPKTHDEDAAPDTPTQRLERPMAFMRSGSFASQVAARQAAAANALQTTMQSAQAIPQTSNQTPSSPPQTQPAPSLPATSEPPTLPRREPSKQDTKDSAPPATPASNPPQTGPRDVTGVPQRESAIPRLFGGHSALREQSIPRLFGQSGDRISSLPRAPTTEAVAPPAPLPDTSSFVSQSLSSPSDDHDPLRDPEPQATPAPAPAVARTDRISALPGRSDRISALPGRSPDRISALPGRPTERTDRISNTPPRTPEAGFPERKSGIPAAPGRSGPPAPLSEEQMNAEAKGPVRPLRAPVPWRKRPASAPGVNTSPRHVPNAPNAHNAQQQPLGPAPGETDSQTKLLFVFAAFALLTAGVLLALRFLR